MNSRKPGFSDAISPLVFRAAARDYGVAEVIGAARFRGELETFQAEWRRSLERGNQAEPAQSAPTESGLEGLANEFRFARNLATPEECERWLAERGLTPEDFQQHIVRCYRAEHSRDDTPPPAGHERVAELALSPPCRTDLLLSDEFDRMARRLAWRVALAADDPGGKPCDRGAPPRAIENPEWESLETKFLARCQELLTPANRQACLERRRTGLLRVELLVVQFDGEAAAQEAYLFSKHDRTTLAEIAAQSRLPLQRVSALIEDLPAEWQPAVSQAVVATLLPPLSIGNDVHLCFLKSQEQPSLDRPDVTTRVDAAILRNYFMGLEARHVEWHVRVEAIP